MKIFLSSSKMIPSLERLGGKAYHLAIMEKLSVIIPKWFCLTSEFFQDFSSFSKEDEAEILKLVKNNKKYAIRSSAVDEDGENASFAGIHETYLNVSKSEIIAKIELCYKSFFTERAIEYRRLHNLSTTNIKAAVIIQEMVESDYAGVINTINPVTSNPDEIVISVVKGLGESLVSGEENSTDYYVNSRGYTKNGDITLPGKILKKIVAMSKTISDNTAHFQDIEFAVKKNRVYFLQTRDIIPFSKYNTKAAKTILDNSNIVESYSGVTTDLTYSFAREIYQKVYTKTLQLGKVTDTLIKELEPSLSSMLAFYDNKIYYNLNSWYHVVSIFPFKKVNSYMENMMGVSIPTTNTKKLHLKLSEILHIVTIFFKKVKTIDADSNAFIERFNEIVMPKVGFDFKEYSLKDLKQYYETLEKEIIDDFTTPIINDCAAMLYMGILKRKVKDEKLLSSIISNQGKVESALSAEMIVNITQKINNDQTLKKDFISLSPEALKQKYENEPSIIKQDIDDYILKFGSRVMDELKLETMTLLEDSTYLYQLLKRFIESGTSLKQTKEDTSNVCIKNRKLEKLALKTKYFIQNRERLRLKRTYIYSVIRKIFLRIGTIFYENGVIDDKLDIFYLTKDEIFRYIDSPYTNNFEASIKTRKATLQENAKKEVYARIVYYGDDEMKVEKRQENVDNHFLKGIPSGAGIVRGKVKLVTSPKNAFVENKIILAYRTDPGWIVLFPLCKGLIVEKGSILSHSAVVAREMGIPAVVNVPGAVKLIKDDTEVLLDAVKGEIHIHE